ALPPSAPTAPTARAANTTSAETRTDEGLPAPAPMPVMPTPSAEVSAHTHFLAIEQALSADERALVYHQLGQMSPEAREILLDQLVGSTVPKGVAILRAQIQDLMPPAAPLAIPAEPPPGGR